MRGQSMFRYVLYGLAAIAVMVLAVAEADAARRSGGFGSRGDRTYSPPAATQTAPNAASPINRSATQPQRPGAQGAATTGAAKGGLFNRPGLMGGLMAGFLGAGLLGLLMGNGLLGGLGGIASFLGLLLQVGIVVIVARLAWNWWQRRNAPGYASASGPAMRDAGQRDAGQYDRQAAAQPSYGGGLAGGGAAPMASGGDVALEEADFDAFERCLSDVQSAYSAQDIAKLRTLATPEVVGYFSEELSENASRGVVNQVNDVKLLQGDLSEAWSEGNSEYATVAMRYSSVDVTTERASGNVVEGSNEPFERVELWTFLRARGGEWILSAVQQA